MASIRLGTRSEGGLTLQRGSCISQPHHPQIDTPPTNALTDKLEMKRGRHALDRIHENFMVYSNQGNAYMICILFWTFHPYKVPHMLAWCCIYRVTMVVVHLGWVDSDLGSSPGRWAVTAAICCPTGGWNILNLSQPNPGVRPPWSTCNQVAGC